MALRFHTKFPGGFRLSKNEPVSVAQQMVCLFLFQFVQAVFSRGLLLDTGPVTDAVLEAELIRAEVDVLRPHLPLRPFHGLQRLSRPRTQRRSAKSVVNLRRLPSHRYAPPVKIGAAYTRLRPSHKKSRRPRHVLRRLGFVLAARC